MHRSSAYGQKCVCRKHEETGVWGKRTVVCWDAGRLVLVLWLAGTLLPNASKRYTDAGSLRLVQGASRQREEDPEGLWQGEVV